MRRVILFIIYKLKSIKYKILLKPYYKLILGYFGRFTLISDNVKFDKPENIYIGSKVFIGRLSWLAAVAYTGKETCALVIGDGTYIGNFAHIYCTSKITINPDVLIADRVYITDNLHEYEDICLPIIKQKIKQLKEVEIGEGSWIGENVCIIGVKIGIHCVIGSNSVVNKDIPDYCVAVGAPARIIKRYNLLTQKWEKTDQYGTFIKTKQ